MGEAGGAVVRGGDVLPRPLVDGALHPVHVRQRPVAVACARTRVSPQLRRRFAAGVAAVGHDSPSSPPTVDSPKHHSASAFSWSMLNPPPAVVSIEDGHCKKHVFAHSSIRDYPWGLQL